MSEKRKYPPEYNARPEPYADLKSVYYDFQEYDLIHSITENGAGQFIDERKNSNIDAEAFAKFTLKLETLERPRLLLVRKSLQELKIMGSIDYSDCYTTYRNVQFNLLEHDAYINAFKFAPRSRGSR